MEKIMLLITLLLIPGSFCASVNNPKKLDHQLEAKVKEWKNNQPILFLENKGQMTNTDKMPVPFVLFKASVSGMDVYITEKGLTYVFVKSEEDNSSSLDSSPPLWREGKEKEKTTTEMAWINMNLKGASIKKENITKEGESVDHFNFFYGHCPNGIYDVKQYEKITIKDIYPGIDWVFYNSSKIGMKYDFIVHPGADLAQIKLIYESKNRLEIDEGGNIHIKTHLGKLTENAPITYVEKTKQKVASLFVKTKVNSYSLNDIEEGFKTEIMFNIGHRTKEQQLETLIIDPQLVWSTFYGGNNFDGPMSIQCDNNGNLFAAGYGASTNFPVQDVGTYSQNTLGIGYDGDVYLWKFNNNGVLLWASYYGGSEYDRGLGMCLDPFGNMYVTGTTFVNGGGAVGDFPLQNAGTYFDPSLSGRSDLFILKFDNAGNRLWATYYGGSNTDANLEYGSSICSDLFGNIYVTGTTASTDFPVQNSGTYFNGTIGGLNDAFILKFDRFGNRRWATYYGGSSTDAGNAICTDAVGNVFLTGITNSTNFPLRNAGTFFQGAKSGGNDAFIAKFDRNGNQIWSTYYGGNSSGNWGGDLGQGICTDATGNLFVIGNTDSNNFPVKNAGTYFKGTIGGTQDAFILKFDNAGNIIWATYYGGAAIDYAASSANSITTDNCGNVYASITTQSTDIAKLNPGCNEYYDATFDGGFGNAGGWTFNDAFFVKFTNIGVLLWATYWGGNGNDFRGALATDINNNLFAAGEWSNYNGNNGTTTIGTLASALANPGGGAYYVGSAPASSGETDDCFFTKFIPVTPSITTSQVNSTGCTCTGSSTVTVTCNAGLFDYVWSNGNQTLNTTTKTNTVTGLCPGTYTVTVTSSCKNITSVVTITGNTGGIALTHTQADALCFGSTTGTASITASGGSSPYTYSWSNGLTSVSASGLSAGVYKVTVRDALGCANIKNIIITEPNAINITSNVISPNCSPTGSIINVFATGGTPTYVYNWSNGQTGATATGINTGTYTVTLTDNKGCTKTQSVSVSNPPALTLYTIFNNTCTGTNSGYGGAIASGGTGSYTYNWSNGQTTDFVYNLSLGNYTVTVTDANGCKAILPINVSNHPPFTLTTTSTPVKCSSNKDGGVTAIATGSTGFFNYSWSAPIRTSYQSYSTVEQLSAGTYTVYVTDGNNCTASATATILSNPPPSPAFTFSPDSTVCAGTTINFTHTGTTAGITRYGWTLTPLNTSVNTQNYSYNFTSAGTYTLTHAVYLGTGAGSCNESKKLTIVVTNCSGSNPSVAALGGGCVNSGDCSKNVTATSAGGTPPYTYSWSTGATTNTIYPCPTVASTYTVTVRDAAGFTSTSTASFTIIPSANFTKSSGRTVCIGTTVNFTGITTPGATYNWKIGAPANVSGTSTNFSYKFIATGTYSIYRSASSTTCGAWFRDTVIVINCSGPSATATGGAICVGNCASITSSGTGGSSPYTYSWSTGATTKDIAPCPLSTTTYTVKVTDKTGATATTTATVTINPAVTASTTVGIINCSGASTGSATATGSSGTSPFTFNWSTGVTTTGASSTIPNLSANTYSVTVTDNKGCTTTTSVTLTAPPPLLGQFTKGTAACSNCGCQEWLMVNATGGTPPYTYQWPDGYDKRYKNKLCAGNYTIKITDKNGCSVNVNITAP